MFPVNITLDACGFIIMLVVLYSIIFESNDKTIRNTLLRAIVISVMAGILLNVAFQLVKTFSSNNILYNVVGTFNLIPSNIWIALLVYYLTSFLKEKKFGYWRVANGCGILLIVNILLVIALGCIGTKYVISKNNFFPNILIYYMFATQLLVCILYIIICFKNKIVLGNHLFTALFLNMIVPLIAISIDFFYIKISTQYFAEAISVVISCVMIQHQEIQETNITLQVTNSELEDHINQIIKLNGSLNERMDIIHSMGKVYFSTYYIDLEKDSFEELSSKNNIRSVIGNVGCAQYSLNLMSETLVTPEFSAKMREFVDLSTINERLKGKDYITFEYIGVTSGWSQIYLIAGDRDENGNLRHVFSATRIIHEEKQRELEQNKAIEDALVAAKAANVAKTAFLSRMSHDIRTPLNGIIGLIEINERHPDDFELHAQNREKAKIAANHLLSLISDVLELTKMDDDNVKLANEAFSASELARQVITISSLRATEAGISIEILDDGSETVEEFVYGSPLHIRQILLNVFGNAIKYNKPHGKITYKTECLLHTETEVTYKVTISDTGIGMSPEFIEHLYEPFSQEHTDARSVYQGTGLGMAIVKTLIEKMGGEVHVTSKLGEGTSFDLIFPFKIAKKEDVVQKVSLEDVDIEGVKILLVEDNDLNMEIAETILVDSGAIVTKAYNGQEAVDIYRNNPSATFDVILMDLMMPVLDGYGATAAIRSSDKRDAKLIPIIAMTANAFTEDIKKCLDAGMNSHVSKPFNISDLFNKIAIVMTR